jgi:hypothetical protein
VIWEGDGKEIRRTVLLISSVTYENRFLKKFLIDCQGVFFVGSGADSAAGSVISIRRCKQSYQEGGANCEQL